MTIAATAPKRVTDGLTVSSTVILIATGTLLWAIGVLLLRWLGGAGLLSGQAQVIVYALTVPGSIPLVPLGRMVARLPASETLSSVAVMAITALLIDGIVIGYYPDLYSSNAETARACAGALLWGVGVVLALAAVMQPRQGRHH